MACPYDVVVRLCDSITVIVRCVVLSVVCVRCVCVVCGVVWCCTPLCVVVGWCVLLCSSCVFQILDADGSDLSDDFLSYDGDVMLYVSKDLQAANTENQTAMNAFAKASAASSQLMSVLPSPFGDRRRSPPTNAGENDGHREDVLVAAVEPLPGADLGGFGNTPPVWLTEQRGQRRWPVSCYP